MKLKLPSFKTSASIKIAIGAVAGIVVIVGGFLLVQNLASRASDTAPRDIIISNISSSSAKIAWTTDQELQGVVEYGSSPTALNLFAPENTKTKTHSVEMTLLSPATSYYFQIRIGDTKHDNGGVPWTFSTKVQQIPVTDSPTPSVGVPTQPQSLTPLAPSLTINPFKSSSLKVKPTLVPTIRRVVTLIPTATSTPVPAITSFYCVETDCQQICVKINRGECSTLNFRSPGGIPANSCVGKVLLGSCFIITPTPTWNPLTPTPTITPTGSPTPTPTLSPTPIGPTVAPVN